MKKLTSLFLVALMLFSAVALASCGAETGFDYRNENLTPYVTLPGYKDLKLQVDVGLLESTVTEAEVLETIDDSLVSAGAIYKQIKEDGTICEMGDTVGITYKGVLVSKLQAAGYAEDGSGLTAEQIKGLEGFQGGETTTATNLQLGSGSYIAGFEEGLAGKTVGTTNTPLALTFPEDYSNSDLKGASVVFFVSIEYKLQLVEPRDLEFGDLIYVTYKAELDAEDEMYRPEAEEKGLLVEEAKTELLTLLDTDQFHSGMIIEFNELDAADRVGKEFTFSEEQNVVVTIEKEIEGAEGEEPTTDITKEDRQVTINYTVTVHKLANVRYFTSEDAKAGTELKYEDFCTKLGVSKDEYPTYDDYVEKLTETMQLAREIQIRTDLYKGAFNALAEKSEVDLDSEEMQALVTAYFNEVVGNIDYMEIQVQTDNNLYYNYQLYTLYNGKTMTVREYVLESYGYTEADLKASNASSKLLTDAEEYVTNRLVFWQYVKTENIALTDEDYHEGYEEYKHLYQYDEDDHDGHSHDATDFLGHLGITEEQLREALLWDKAAKHLAENYCDVHKVPVKEA